MAQEFLFICGCPRSGTTALVRLLNAHHSIAIGMERYKYYANKKNIAKINRDLFRASSFFKLQDNQTNIQWKYFYKDLQDKYKFGVKYLGDKYPHYYRYYQQINENLDNTKWLFIIRDVVSIAKSYNARAADPDDSWSKSADYKKAVEHWNESLVETWKYQKSNPQPNLFVCEYEKLFSYDLEYMRAIFDFLDLNLDANTEVYFNQMKQDWLAKQKSSSKSSNSLNQSQLEYINHHAKHSLKNNLLKRFSCPIGANLA